MSEAPAAARQAEPQLPPELRERRFIGVKETFGYTLFKASQEFNINKYSDRFIFDVLKIDFYYLSIVTAVGGVWDVINDMLIGTIVDKTRTRWGKFKTLPDRFRHPGHHRHLPVLDDAAAVPQQIGDGLLEISDVFRPRHRAGDGGHFSAASRRRACSRPSRPTPWTVRG